MTLVGIATVPLTVEYDGERQLVQAGEIVPRFDEWAEGPRNAILDNERVVLITEAGLVAEVASIDEDYRKELFAALKAEGFTVTQPKTVRAAA